MTCQTWEVPFHETMTVVSSSIDSPERRSGHLTDTDAPPIVTLAAQDEPVPEPFRVVQTR